VLAGGGLEHDRRWQLVDMEGRVVNAKRLAILHAIRAIQKHEDDVQHLFMSVFSAIVFSAFLIFFAIFAIVTT